MIRHAKLAGALPAGLAVVALMIVALTSVAAVLPAPHADAALKVRATIQDVAEGLTCQCGCGLTVANCNHPDCGFSIPARTEIGKMIGRGMSRGEILASFQAKYGEKILSAPIAQGFNLLAWIMPFVAVGLGGLLIVLAAGRWRRQSAAASVGTADPAVKEEFASGLKERLEEELRRQR